MQYKLLRDIVACRKLFTGKPSLVSLHIYKGQIVGPRYCFSERIITPQPPSRGHQCPATAVTVFATTIANSTTLFPTLRHHIPVASVAPPSPKPQGFHGCHTAATATPSPLSRCRQRCLDNDRYTFALFYPILLSVALLALMTELLYCRRQLHWTERLVANMKRHHSR